jgi:lipopolysaccharide export system protein LptA
MGTKTLKNSRWLFFILLLALLPAQAPGAGAAAPAKKDAKAAKSDFPLRITAARLEADQKDNVIIFSGKVKADYGEATLYADELRVFFKPKAEAPPGKAPTPTPPENQGPLGDLGGEKIDRIVARGQVRFVQEDRVATGEEAIYYKDRDEVVLRGRPQLWQAENTLKGERIVFNLKTNKMMVESSPQKRVEAVLYSKTQGKEAKELLPLKPKPKKGQ